MKYKNISYWEMLGIYTEQQGGFWLGDSGRCIAALGGQRTVTEAAVAIGGGSLRPREHDVCTAYTEAWDRKQ
jgi:hypothetical protein